MPEQRKPPEKVLTFVSWYVYQGVYLDGVLVAANLELEPASKDLLQNLGYSCFHLKEIPTHDIPKEFDRDDKGWWLPPTDLSTLETQIAAWKARLKREEIEDLKARLKELESDHA